MDTRTPFVSSESPSGFPFDVQGFKNLLETLKESKRQQETKAKPSPDYED